MLLLLIVLFIPTLAFSVNMFPAPLARYQAAGAENHRALGDKQVGGEETRKTETPWGRDVTADWLQDRRKKKDKNNLGCLCAMTTRSGDGGVGGGGFPSSISPFPDSRRKPDCLPRWLRSVRRAPPVPARSPWPRLCP